MEYTIRMLEGMTEPQGRVLMAALQEGIDEYVARLRQCKDYDHRQGILPIAIAMDYHRDDANIHFLQQVALRIESDLSLATTPAKVQESA